MRKVITVLLIVLGVTLIAVAISINAFPEWLTIPGGLLILLGIAFNAVLDLGSKIKDWVELLFTKEKGDISHKASVNYGEIRQQGGPNIVAANIDHLEVHSSSENKLQDIASSPRQDIKLRISASERVKDHSPHIEVVVINDENRSIFCRAKSHAIYDSTGKNIKRDISDYANHFSWSGGSDKGTKEIPAGLDATINLVRTNHSGYGIAFMFDENPKSYWMDEGVYTIDLEIAGTIEDGKIRTGFVGRRAVIEFLYKKNETLDDYGQVINNGGLKLLATKLKD